MLLSALSSKLFWIVGGVAVAAVIFFIVIVIIARNKSNSEPTPQKDNIEKIVDEQAKKKKAAAQDDSTVSKTADGQSKPSTGDEAPAQPNDSEDKSEPEQEDSLNGKKEHYSEALTRYRVIYDKESKTWVIKKDGAKRIIRRVRTKEEALKIAKDLSKNQDTAFIVHKKDGKFQKK